KDWFDDECRKAVQERTQARMKMLEDNTRERIEQYKRIRNRTQTNIRNKKREAQKAKLEEIEEHYGNRNTKLFYKNLKEEKKGFQPQTVALKNHQGEICVDTTIINKRIQEDIEEKIGQYQAGFRNGKLVINHIFALRQIQEKCGKKDIPIHGLFLDFKQAFDKINRKNLIEAIQSLNIPTELVQL
ncbi:hypothetical protein ILUMI_12911, partial [Ignelater luminosus]